jgi:hypothetical protein
METRSDLQRPVPFRGGLDFGLLTADLETPFLGKTIFFAGVFFAAALFEEGVFTDALCGVVFSGMSVQSVSSHQHSDRQCFAMSPTYRAAPGHNKIVPLAADRVNLKVRADAFNALNRLNFALPGAPSERWDITGGTLGQLTSMASIPGALITRGYSVMQFALRLESDSSHFRK